MMVRNVAAILYYWSARFMPLWFRWQWVYVMRCRFYMEQRTADSWPWRFTGYEAGKTHVCDFGKRLDF